jgi:hypothetical protein
VSWREQIARGYPWQPVVFAAVMLVFALVAVISMLTTRPAELAVIDHGTNTIGHADAYHINTRRSEYYAANLTWTDDHGHAREQRGLTISASEYRAIGDGKDVEIRYIDDVAVIVADMEYRVRDESNAPFVLGAFAIALLLGLYHWRRRLREWRADLARS